MLDREAWHVRSLHPLLMTALFCALLGMAAHGQPLLPPLYETIAPNEPGEVFLFDDPPAVPPAAFDEPALDEPTSYGLGDDEPAGEAAPDVETLLQHIEELEAAEAARTAKEQKKAEDEKLKKEEEEKKALDWVDLSSEKWTVKLGGHVQMDYINWADADPAIVGRRRTTSSSAACGWWPTARATASTTSACR